MYYVGTSVISRNLGITNKQIYELIRKKVISRPKKKNGRYLWSEKNASEIVRSLSLLNIRDPLSFTQEDVRYLGNKAKYSFFLRDVVVRNIDYFDSFADYFAGSGGAEVAFTDKKLILNDILTLSATYLKAWYLGEPVNTEKIRKIIFLYNGMDPMHEDYVSKNYAGTYFGASVARKIDFIRDDIKAKRITNKINDREEAVLLVSLVQAMNKAANIYSNYDSHKKPPIIWKSLELEVPMVSNNNREDNLIFNTDANVIAPFNYSDVTYIDLPPTSRQYADIYHVTENVVTWKKPELNRKSLKPENSSKKSLYSRNNAVRVLEDLMNEIHSKLVLVSLPKVHGNAGSRNASRISLEEYFELLSRYGQIHVEFPEMENSGSQMYFNYDFRQDSRQDEEENIKGGVIVLNNNGKTRKRIKFPVNFSGERNRIWNLVVPFLPMKIGTMHVIGAENLDIPLNSDSRNIVLHDTRKDITDFVSELMKCDKKEFLDLLKNLVEEFSLSDSDRYGYEYYKVSSEEGLAGVNRKSYGKLRDAYYQEKDAPRKAGMFYLLLIYGYVRMPRFTRKMVFAPTIGKRDYNIVRKTDQENFLDDRKRVKLVADNLSVSGVSEMADALASGDFLFCDMPLNYDDEQFGKKHQKKDVELLVNTLEILDARHIRYAVLYNRDNKSETMEKWLLKGRDSHRIIPFDNENLNNIMITNY